MLPISHTLEKKKMNTKNLQLNIAISVWYNFRVDSAYMFTIVGSIPLEKLL